VKFLTQQDYTGAIFADDSFGPLLGALPMSAIRLVGAAVTPRPAIVVSFRSFGTGCPQAEMCAGVVADTDLGQGQGMHGSLSRAESRNFMAAIGPDFKSGFVDPAPVGNADLAPTIMHILGFASPPSGGSLRGRVIAEALRDGPATAAFVAETHRSTPAESGFQTILNLQRADESEYYDAAGAPGRSVGLAP
jgi:hypothetical protein